MTVCVEHSAQLQSFKPVEEFVGAAFVLRPCFPLFIQECVFTLVSVCECMRKQGCVHVDMMGEEEGGILKQEIC